MTEQELRNYLTDYGYEDTVLFDIPSYISAVEGISETGQIIYDYDKMIEYLVSNEGMTDVEAVEFIDFNTIRALPYMGEKAPIVKYGLQDIR